MIPETLIAQPLDYTALGYLTDSEQDKTVGGLTIRERLHVIQGSPLKIMRTDNISLNQLSIRGCDTLEIDEIKTQGIWNKLVVPERYQRNFVKSTEEQQSILGAIFEKTLTNPLYFSYDSTNNIIEIIDGQQRWRSLMNFVENKLRLGDNVLVNGIEKDAKINIGGLTYDEIKTELPGGNALLTSLFSTLELPYVLYKGTEEQIRTQFRALNTGATGLNKMELLLSWKSSLYEYVREENNRIDFDKVGVETTRFTAAEMILKLYYYHIKGPKKVSLQDLRNLKDSNIKSNFKDIVKQLEIFINSIPTTAKSQYGKGTIRALGYFLSDIHSEYKLSIKDSDYDKFFHFVDDMFTTIRDKKGQIKDEITGDKYFWLDDVLRYDDTAHITLISNEMKLYIDLILSKLNGNFTEFLELSGIQLKHSNRNISKLQRWEVLLNQKSICPECGKKIHLGDDAHHIEHYAHGGENEVYNIKIMHKECHIELHKNDSVSTRDSENITEEFENIIDD
jgi:hypothetical protein